MDNLAPSLDDKSSSSSSDSGFKYNMVSKVLNFFNCPIIMASFKVNLTPPRNPQEANMTPSMYLSSKSTLATIKRKIPLDLNESHSKRLKLDPSPQEEDTTILKYVSRTQQILPDDREKMAVELPATQVLGGIQVYILLDLLTLFISFFHL